MTFDQLKEKALSLPYAPGVYIMRDKENTVIYVGKAKKLKNRVSQYFQDTASHTPKTRLMVSHIDHFDVIVAASEFEALVLECSLIKRHMPKYNILLKDDKGYPYIRLGKKELYPKITLVSKIAKDGAEYFGPFGSRGTTQNVIDTIVRTLRLPQCSREFPRDIGKDRPCLNYHMNQCAGWCRPEMTREEYLRRIDQARQLLNGDYKAVANQIRQAMQAHAGNLEFEQAAVLRDRLAAVEALGQKQLVTALSKACIAVLHFSGGNLLDKDYEVFALPDDRENAVSSLVKQYYLRSGMAPKNLLLPFAMDDGELFAQYLEQQNGKKVRIHVPQRGDGRQLVELACKNAKEEAVRLTGKEEKVGAALMNLGKMLAMEPPARIESYDISNISGTDIVAGMVVFKDGKPHRSEYKRFQIEGLDGQDDYGSMRQVITRRFQHYIAGDKGFTEAPSLLLIDGGVVHAKTALAVLQELKLDFPVFGMVKDDRHRTRALVTPDGREIGIDTNQAVFSLVGNIQEETHRFAITYHRQKRSKRLRYSALDAIPGIGPKRKQELLKQFKSISAISAASIQELERLLPKDAAASVYHHFRQDQEDKGCE